MKLSEKNCIPCQGGTPPLEKEATDKLLIQLERGWTINANGHLQREYEFKNFMGPMQFANKIAEVAEQQGHHPDLKISWGKCGVEIWTHKINGLTESDFYLAAKIDELKKAM